MLEHVVLGLVRSASKQFGEYGIRVNNISTSMTPLMISAEVEVSMKVLKKYGLQTSLKVITLMVKHLAEAALFLASDDSSFVSGHDLGVDVCWALTSGYVKFSKLQCFDYIMIWQIASYNWRSTGYVWYNLLGLRILDP
ncbi:hypothetical protein H5410_016468 [Solanum commersonii]|uniref:Uncharacterized protein n=1 Tax=Solanum commersonii TaxID=4109 RepID=A0A9J5ZXG4_SOLCO|nr:hypothetical protein H5410_016468 [Solanum commersonii]